MISGYVARQISRTNRNLLIWNALLAIAILITIVLSTGYVREALTGPHKITVDEIDKLSDAGQAPHKFVSVDIDQEELDNNYYQITGGKEKKKDWYFFLRLKSGRFLILKTHSENPPTHIDGSLTTASGDVERHVIPGIAFKVNGQPHPVVLDGSSYRAGLWCLGLTVIPLSLLAAWNILSGIRRMGDPTKHPIAKHIAHLGPPDEIALSIEAELAEGASRVGKVTTTRSWLIQPSTFGTDLVYMGDIVWAYKHETVHKTYGVTTNRTYATIVHDALGRRWNFPLKLEQVETLLRELNERVPWAIIGFDQQLEKLWQKNRQEVLRIVEERKQKISSEPPPPEPPPSEPPPSIPPVQP